MKRTLGATILLFLATVTMNARSNNFLGGTIRIAGQAALDGGALTKLLRLGESIAEQRVGEDGQFRFENVPSGPYEISIQPFGLSAVIVPVTIIGSQADLLIEIRKPTAAGQVLDLREKARTEMTLAQKAKDLGKAKDMERHLKKAASLGSREAQTLLKSLRPSSSKDAAATSN